jgi:hypothetical protein
MPDCRCEPCGPHCSCKCHERKESLRAGRGSRTGDLIGLITDEPETAYIVKEEANESYKVFLDVENAREENNRGHWKARALYPADFPRVADDG